MVESQNIPSLGGITGSSGTGGTSNWLRTGANAADAVAGFLNGRNIRRKLDDHDDALSDSRDARAELDNLERSGIGTALAVGARGRVFCLATTETTTAIARVGGASELAARPARLDAQHRTFQLCSRDASIPT